MARSNARSGARNSEQTARRGKRGADDGSMAWAQEAPKPVPKVAPSVEAKTDAQKRYMNAIKSSQLTFGVGPAGTGKTWVCVGLAAAALHSGLIDKLIITRPAVEAGESLGFLPGELEEKFDPYLQPFKEALYEFLGKGPTEYMIKAGRIEAAPLAYMRGQTFKNAWVILDEAQNTTPKQMKMFLTRIGHDSKVIVNGDIAQADIHGKCGLEDAIERIGYIPSIRVVKFAYTDIVRSGLCQEIVQAYEQPVVIPERQVLAPERQSLRSALFGGK